MKQDEWEARRRGGVQPKPIPLDAPVDLTVDPIFGTKGPDYDPIALREENLRRIREVKR